MFSFDNSSSGKSCLVIDLVYFLSPSIKVLVFVTTTTTERNLPQYKKVFFRFSVRL